jgi:spermidine synthase
MLSATQPARLRTLTRILSGMAVAVVVGQLIASWLTLCGASSSSLAALALGFGVGALLLTWLDDRIPTYMTGWRQNLYAGVLAVLVIALSWCVSFALNVTLLAGCDSIPSAWPLSTMLTMLFPAMVVALVTAAAGLFFRLANPLQNIQWSDLALEGAPGVLLLLLPFWLGFSALPLAIWSTVAIGLALTIQFLKPAFGQMQDQFRNGGTNRLTFAQMPQSVFDTALPFAAGGMLIVALIEILGRLMPGSLPVLIQAVCITALALFTLSRPLAIRLLKPKVLKLASILILASLPILFGPLASLNLEINTSGFSATLVLFLRSMQWAAFATAAFVPALCTANKNQYSNSAQSVIVPLITGVVISLVAATQNLSPVLILAAGIAVHAIASLGRALLRQSDSSETLRRFAFPALSLVSTLLIVCGSIETSRTSSFLFSERTVAAVQRGVDRDLIAQSHASRLVTAVPTASGELTVWRRTGNVSEFQRNGMPIGRISTDTSISPQPVEDILPAILALVNHRHPSRVLVLGDDTGTCLRVCTHFPVQKIVAVRKDVQTTELARQFTWSRQQQPPDKDKRVRILHDPEILAVRRRELDRFDVVIASGNNTALDSDISRFTMEFYDAVRSRMNAGGVFCQCFRQRDLGPEPLKATIATLMKTFANVGVIQTVPGEIVLLASDSENGLLDSEFLSRLQRDHVRREIATSGWDWAQVAILPLVDARDPIGMFGGQNLVSAMSVANGGLATSLPYEAVRVADKQSELHAAFGPHQQQILAASSEAEDREEVKRRLSALAQQLEILAGMPDQPWTYRKSLQMEMKQSPRPPQDLIESGRIRKVAHPLDLLRQNYFVSLGKALSAASRGELDTNLIHRLDTFTDNFEPLISHFAHYEIVRLHELSQHPAPIEEFRHRLHIVFFTSPTDASVRPVISTLQQLVDQPSLIADDTERYDMLNSLLQKMIERWEARTAWEPRSALRVQNDVDLSVGVANRAMAMMEDLCHSAAVEKSEFYTRRRFVNAALIGPLRDYRDQVLAHRMKSEAPVEINTEDPHDVPLLIGSGSGLNTN